MPHTKKFIESMLSQIEEQQQHLNQHNQTIKKVKITCTILGHVHRYEKDDAGNFISKCYSCRYN